MKLLLLILATALLLASSVQAGCPDSYELKLWQEMVQRNAAGGGGFGAFVAPTVPQGFTVMVAANHDGSVTITITPTAKKSN
jgi:hypothetical protein